MQEVCQHCWNIFAPADQSHLCPTCRGAAYVCSKCGRTVYGLHLCFFVPFPWDTSTGERRR